MLYLRIKVNPFSCESANLMAKAKLIHQNKLHTVYKAISPEEMERVLSYCKENTCKKGGPFEIYPGEINSQIMVLVNSNHEKKSIEKLKPLGSFYCNYMGEGIISFDQAEDDYDAIPSAKEHIKAIKQVIDILIEKAYPGVPLKFPSL